MSRLRLGGRRGVALAVAGLMGVGGLATLGTSLAAAAVPTFPDNVVVFPDRDFITIEGYQDHVDETALVEVKRAGKVIGSAKGVVKAGDVAFEINHPGGYCWGAGTGLNVTPDIKPGDVATITFPNGETGDTTTSSAMVTSDSVLSGSTLTVTGSYGGDVNTAQMEQRIINPDLVTTAVAKRDIRAVSGPLTPAPKGGYASGLTFDAGTFTATYVFEDPAVAKIASQADLGERAMSWQKEDADGNRQGLTIAEFGEAGGPGMGGCPAGPTNQAPSPGNYSAIRNVAMDKYAVSWTPATATPTGADVTGYSVEAVEKTTGAVIGVRTGVDVSKTTLTVLPAGDYTIEVRALTVTNAATNIGGAFPGTTTQAKDPGTPDTTAPKLVFNPAANPDVAVETDAVTLSSEAGADIYYTTDGSAAVAGDLPGDTAKLYTGPVKITAETTLKAVAFDRAGNIDSGMGLYKPGTPAPVALPAPTGLIATPGPESIALSWTSVPEATSYQVKVTATTGVTVTQPGSTTATSQTITGLTAGTKYTFTVTASDATRTSAPSASLTATPNAVLARVTITTGRWKNGDTRIQGAVDRPANVGTIKFYRYANGTRGAVLFTGVASPLTAAVAPATGSTYDARFRNVAQTGTVNPGTVVAVLADGTNVLGASAPFTLSNG